MSASIHNSCPMGIEVTLIDNLICPVLDTEILAMKLCDHPEIVVVRFKIVHRSKKHPKGADTFFDLKHGCNVTELEVDVPTIAMDKENYYNHVAGQMFRTVLQHIHHNGQYKFH